MRLPLLATQELRGIDRVMGMIAVAACGIVWLIQHDVRTLAAAKQQLRAAEDELSRITRSDPAPTAANATLIEADLASAAAALASLRTRFSMLSPERATSASSETAAKTADYFAIAQFVADMRAQAKIAGVRHRADEYFGFSAYEHVGPSAAVRGQVLSELAVAKHILHAALDPKPFAILKVERVETAASTATSEAEMRSAEFEVAMAGETSVLRDFLNQLSRESVPLVVSSVEVQPMPADEKPSDGLAAVMHHVLARFTVRIKCFWLEAGAPSK